MMVRDGLATNLLVELPWGVPDADPTWSVLDADGVVLDSGTVTVPADAISFFIPLSAAVNTISSDLETYRDVVWSYVVGGQIENGEDRYRVEARIPKGASANGVRAKLGSEKVDLPDDQIYLMRAYLSLRNAVGEANFDAVATTDYNDIALRDGIEATAALALIPTMALRVAQSEDSGTNSFKRQNVDWKRIEGDLENLIGIAYAVADATFDEEDGYTPLIVLATPPTDAFTGA